VTSKRDELERGKVGLRVGWSDTGFCRGRTGVLSTKVQGHSVHVERGNLRTAVKSAANTFSAALVPPTELGAWPLTP
jgi:hypothetical protein